MKSIFILLITVFTISFHSECQENLQLKRVPYVLTVAVDKKVSYEEDLKETPFVLPDNTIQLYPGETIHVEVEQTDSVIKSMRAVKEIKDSSKTLTIGFIQHVNKKTHESMMLKIINPFAKNLTYKARIFLFKQKKWVDTDVLPVEAGLGAFETWPNIIISIALGEWKFD